MNDLFHCHCQSRFCERTCVRLSDCALYSYDLWFFFSELPVLQGLCDIYSGKGCCFIVGSLSSLWGGLVAVFCQLILSFWLRSSEVWFAWMSLLFWTLHLDLGIFSLLCTWELSTLQRELDNSSCIQVYCALPWNCFLCLHPTACEWMNLQCDLILFNMLT